MVSICSVILCTACNVATIQWICSDAEHNDGQLFSLDFFSMAAKIIVIWLSCNCQVNYESPVVVIVGLHVEYLVEINCI